MKIDADGRKLDGLIKNLDLIEKYMIHSVPDEGNDVSEDSLNAHLFLLNRVRGALNAWRINDEYDQIAHLQRGDVDDITGLVYDPKLTLIK
jgi:hypothetical protein